MTSSPSRDGFDSRPAASPPAPESGGDDAILNAAVAALLAEEIPAGPPRSVEERLAAAWSVRAEAERTTRPVSARAAAGGPRMSRLASTLLAAAVVLVCVAGWQFLGAPGNVALADVAKEIRRARNIQFRVLGFVHELGEGPAAPRWRVVSFSEHNYRAPGFYRYVSFDPSGIPWQIVTEDAVRGLKLELRTTLKTATLTDESCAVSFRGGDFPSALRQIEETLERGEVRKELGTREIGGRRVVGLRIWDGQEEADFWIDRRTQQIVRYQQPTAAVYDPETDPALPGPVPAGTRTAGTELKGAMWTDIVYDAPLDVAQYVLTPPEDYAVEHLRYRLPTEKDLLEWLEVFARVRGGTFTESENSPMTDPAVSERLSKTPAAEQTEWEKSLLRGFARKEEVPLLGNGTSVLVNFWSMYRGTWHYQGKGVHLGDSETAICWYRPQEAGNYRVVYGDLSVKEVSPEKLPTRR